MIISINGNDVTKYVAKFSFETSLDDVFSTVKFSLPFKYYVDKRITVFSKVEASSGGGAFEFKGKIINTEVDNVQRVNLTIVSNEFGLSSYEEMFKINKISATEAIEKVLSYYDGSITVDGFNMGTKITQFYKNDTIISIIDDIISQHEGNIGQRIYRTFENNVLYIFTDPKPYEVELKARISNLKLSYNGEDIKTKVKVYTEEKKKVSVIEEAENKSMVEKAGLIQKVHKIKAKEKNQAELIAKNILTAYGSEKRTGSFDMLGDYNARIGSKVMLEDQRYIISGLKHTIDDEIHLMKVEVLQYDKQ